VQLKELRTAEFIDYCRRVVVNSRALADELMSLGYSLVTGGTDNHLVLLDLKTQGLSGAKMQLVSDAVKISLNKCACPGDTSPLVAGGVRVGSPAMTTRGADEAGFRQIALLLHLTVQLGQSISAKSGPELADFKALLAQGSAEIEALRQQVYDFASALPLPGVDVGSLRQRGAQIEA
jgi:glycine hydroxymethyltransferase